jgi:hypothetical protein
MLDLIQIYRMDFKILSTLIDYIYSNISLYMHQIQIWIISDGSPKFAFERTRHVRVHPD